LLKQDANGATALLGGAESSVPADAKWAREITEALSTGGEAEVRFAKNIESELDDLAALFPAGGANIALPADTAAMREALASDNIHEHLPALRSAMRSTVDRVRARFAERRATYVDSLHSVLRGAGWRLAGEERDSD